MVVTIQVAYNPGRGGLLYTGDGLRSAWVRWQSGNTRESAHKQR